MMIHQTQETKRRAPAVVEMAVVSILLFMMLFGIFEYCRLLYVMHGQQRGPRHGSFRGRAYQRRQRGERTDDDLKCRFNRTRAERTDRQPGRRQRHGGHGKEHRDSHGRDSLSILPPFLEPEPACDSAACRQRLDRAAAFNQKIAADIRKLSPHAAVAAVHGLTVPIQVTVMSSSEAN